MPPTDSPNRGLIVCGVCGKDGWPGGTHVNPGTHRVAEEPPRPPAAPSPPDLAAIANLVAIAREEGIRIKVVVDTDNPGLEGHPIALYRLEKSLRAATSHGKGDSTVLPSPR